MTLSRLAGNQRTGGAGAAARRRGLAGAGLGAAQKIAPGKEMRDRLGLDRRRRGVALGTDRALDRLDQPEAGKSSQMSVSLGWPSAGGTPTLIGSGHPARGRGSLSVHRFCLGMLPPAWMTQACFARSRGLVRFMSSSIDAGSKRRNQAFSQDWDYCARFFVRAGACRSIHSGASAVRFSKIILHGSAVFVTDSADNGGNEVAGSPCVLNQFQCGSVR